MKARVFTLTIAILLVIVFVPIAVVHANDTIRVTINNQQVSFEGQGPVLVEGRTLVPIRGVFEVLGFDVTWNNATQQATLIGAEAVIVVTVDSRTFTTNGISHSLDVPAQVIGGRTMLPIRAVLESVGYYFGWDGTTSTVLISSVPLPPLPSLPPAPAPNPQPAPTPGAINPAEFERRVFELTNEERVRYGLTPFIWNDTLANLSRAHSIDLAVNNIMGHIGSDGSHPGERTDRAGITWSYLAENVAAGRSDPATVVAGWMNLPGHRANILNPNLTHLGVGFYQLEGSQFRYYSTQKFATIH